MKICDIISAKGIAKNSKNSFTFICIRHENIANGFTRLEYHSFDVYNKALKLREMIERYKERTGCCPEKIIADKIYKKRDNIAQNVKFTFNRPKKYEIRHKKQDYIDETGRVKIERKFRIRLIMTKLKNNFLPPCYIHFSLEPPKNR